MVTRRRGSGPAASAKPAQRSRKITVPSQPERVGDARREVAEFLRSHGVLSVVVDDLQLVVSELVTNAVMYGVGDVVEVDVRLDRERGNDVVIEVSNVGATADIPDVVEWRPAPPTVDRGRGLGIVRRLSDDVVVRNGDGRATIVVRRRLPDGAAPIERPVPPDSVP